MFIFNKSSSPSSVEVNQILNLQKEGYLIKAYEECKKLINKHPQSELLYNIAGVIKSDKKEFDKALLSYLFALKINPNYAQVYNNLGVLLKKLGEFNTSILSYIRAINLKPNYVQAYNNLGLAYLEKNETNKALTVFLKALNSDFNNENSNFNIGTVYYKKKNFKEAEIYFKNAISLNPKFTEAYYNLGIIYHDQNKLNLAKKYYQDTLKLDPKFSEAEHILNSISGKTSKFAPREYVEKLFDNYANEFDNSLLNDLNYKTPKIIKKIILNDKNNKSGSVLDLGCGTGLMGEELKLNFHYIDGVDLSKLMIEKAYEKKIYRNLFHEEIERHLNGTILDYDYFVAADVFVYIGDLSNIFRIIKNKNKRKGRLIFSTEHCDREEYALTNKGRYTHSRKYIENLCKRFGYNIIFFDKFQIRKDNDINIIGGLYHLEFI